MTNVAYFNTRTVDSLDVILPCVLVMHGELAQLSRDVMSGTLFRVQVGVELI
jgi:hypothetical protein